MAFVVDRIDHVVLNCRDVDTTIDWYVRVLGMRREVFGDNRMALRLRQPEDQRASHRRAELGDGRRRRAGLARPVLHRRDRARTTSARTCGACGVTDHRGPGPQDRRARPDDIALLPRPRRQPDRGRQLFGPRLAFSSMTAGRFSTDVYAQRLRAAAAAAADAGLAGLVITPGYDLRYLVGSRAQTFERLTALVLPASAASRPSSCRGWNWPR